MKFRITFAHTGETFGCDANTNVLAAMEGALCKGLPVGCRNGGCGACKSRVIDGPFATRKMSRAVLSQAEEQRGYVLACKTYPQGDLTLVAAGVGRDARSESGFPDETAKR